MGQAAAADAEFSRGELLQASVELTRHALGYVRSMAVACAAQLGVADAIRRGGGEVSLDSLLAALSLPASKLPYLGRVMRVLTASGVFAVADGGGSYRLTPVSTLLLSDAAAGGSKSMLQLVKLQLSPFSVAPVTNLSDWFTNKEEETPFTMTFGTDLWGLCGRDPAFMELFNGAMACDSRFVMDAVVHEMGDVFDGVTSMVDMAGGTGAAAKAVAAAFPRIKCSVLDLPQVIDGVIPADVGLVEFVAGDMMDFIPQADALLLKFVLHDWSDEDCVTILKRCKDACKEPGGKVIIINAVVGSTSQEICHETQLLFDLVMLTLTPGKEREEKEWCKLFREAGFSNYKIRSMLGFRSVIEVFP